MRLLGKRTAGAAPAGEVGEVGTLLDGEQRRPRDDVVLVVRLLAHVLTQWAWRVLLRPRPSNSSGTGAVAAAAAARAALARGKREAAAPAGDPPGSPLDVGALLAKFAKSCCNFGSFVSFGSRASAPTPGLGGSPVPPVTCVPCPPAADAGARA